jgi:HAMP domain-containing protein
MTQWLVVLGIVIAAVAIAWRWLLSESDSRQRQHNRKLYERERSAAWWE